MKVYFNILNKLGKTFKKFCCIFVLISKKLLQSNKVNSYFFFKMERSRLLKSLL